MSNLLAAEWIKMRKRWMPRILLLLMMGIITVIFIGVSTTDHRGDVTLPRSLLASLGLAGSLAPFLWPVLAGAWSGNEYSWGTMRLILTRRPNRMEQVGAGAGVLLGFTLAALLIALLLGAVAGLLVGAFTGHLTATNGLGSDTALTIVKAFFAIAYGAMLFALLAYAAGTIFQSPAAGIGIGIGFGIAEQILAAIFRGLGGAWESIAQHFPFQYASALADRVLSPLFRDGLFNAGHNAPGAVQSLIGLGVYAAILVGLTLFAVTHRDVTA